MIKFDKRENFKYLLLEISSVDNYSLKTEFLNLMNLMHSHGRVFKENLESLQFITSEKLGLFNSTKKITKELQTICNNVTMNYSKGESGRLMEVMGSLE